MTTILTKGKKCKLAIKTLLIALLFVISIGPTVALAQIGNALKNVNPTSQVAVAPVLVAVAAQAGWWAATKAATKAVAWWTAKRVGEAAATTAIIGGVGAAAATALAPAGTFGDCLKGKITDCLAGIMTGVISIVSWLLSWLVQVAAAFFDVAIYFSIVLFPEFANSAGIKGLWTLVRDFSNIFFIFILLYIAITTMLRVGTDPKNLLVKVIIAAILINFSWALTRVVIDVSNVAAVEFYKPLTDDQTSKISEKFLGAINAEKIVNPGKFEGAGLAEATKSAEPPKAVTILVQGIFGLLVGMVALTVLVAGGVLLIVRVASLLLLIIASPIAFLAFAVPGALSGFFTRWSRALLNQAFFAPAYLLLLYISISIMSQTGFAAAYQSMGGEGLIVEVFATLLLQVLGISLMIAALVVSKSMGAIGADTAMTWGRRASIFGGSLLGGVVGGTASYLGGARLARSFGAGLKQFENNVPGGKFIGTQLRNLPLYGRDAGKAGIDVLGAITKSYGADILPTTANRKDYADMWKSGTKYQKELSDERAVAEARRILEENEAALTASEEGKSGDELAKIRAAKADAKENIGRAMTALGSKGQEALGKEMGVGGIFGASDAYLYAVSGDVLKKIRENENLSDSAIHKLMNRMAKLGNGKAVTSAMSTEDLTVLNDWLDSGDARDAVLENLNKDQADTYLGNMDEFGLRTGETGTDGKPVIARDGKGTKKADSDSQRAAIEKLKASVVRELPAAIIAGYLQAIAKRSKDDPSFKPNEAHLMALMNHSDDSVRTNLYGKKGARVLSEFYFRNTPAGLDLELTMAEKLLEVTPEEQVAKAKAIKRAHGRAQLYNRLSTKEWRRKLGIDDRDELEIDGSDAI